MSYNYFPCVRGRSINNIRKYKPIFRDTLIMVWCLGSYICTVVLEAGNRVWGCWLPKYAIASVYAKGLSFLRDRGLFPIHLRDRKKDPMVGQ